MENNNVQNFGDRIKKISDNWRLAAIVQIVLGVFGLFVEGGEYANYAIILIAFGLLWAGPLCHTLSGIGELIEIATKIEHNTRNNVTASSEQTNTNDN